MTGSRDYAISLQVVPSRMIAGVHARLPVRAVPGAFRQYLDQVYAAKQSGAVHLDGQNVFVYRNVPDRRMKWTSSSASA